MKLMGSLLECDHVWVVNNFKENRPVNRSELFIKNILAYYFKKNILIIKRTPLGKPFVEPEDGSSLSFNIAHSDHVLVAIISRDGTVGIDVEKLRPRKLSGRIAKRYFLAHEQGQDLFGFYRSWTAREAFVKAIGSGLARNIAKVAVKLDGDDIIVGLDSIWSHHTRFFYPFDGFIAAISRDINSRKALKYFFHE